MEMADYARAECIAGAVNAEVIRKRKTKEIVEIRLLESGNDFALESLGGSSLYLVHNHESPTNPPKVYELKKVLRPESTVIAVALTGEAAGS